MSDQLLTAKMLFWNIGINCVASLIASVVTGTFSDSYSIFIVTFIVVFVGISLRFWNKYKRLIKIIFSGCSGYYYSFDIEENPKVWGNATKAFCYLGISCDSIMEPFRRWIEKNSLPTYRILLMKPYSDSLKRQEAFQKGYAISERLEELPPEARQAVDIASNATSKRIESAISVLQSTTPYLKGNMQIRLYDEFSPWWMYLIDDRKAYIGILEKGKRGSESPVLVMERNDQYASPFDAFKNHWERLWLSAEKTDA